MALSTNIDLSTILLDIGRAYNTETSGSSVVMTVNLSTGPQYSLSLARNLVSQYTNGSNPINGNDFDSLNNFASDLRTLEQVTNDIYTNSVKSLWLSAVYAKLDAFIASAYGTNLRTYLNTPNYSSATGPAYDVHGGFAQSFLDNKGNSLVFKVAEIVCSGSYVIMTHGPMSYRGIGGMTRQQVNSCTGSRYFISDENVSTSLFTGPYNTIFEYASSGSLGFCYILGSSGSYLTLAYPRVYDAGYAAPTGSSSLVAFRNISFGVQHQPAFRQTQTPNALILKATRMVQNGDRDFVFRMVTDNSVHPTSGSTEQTNVITVTTTGDTSTITGTTGNTSFYRAFSLVSANNLQDGEMFEIWVQN